MKASIFSLILMLCVSVCFAAESHMTFFFSSADIPAVVEEPHFTFEFLDWEQPTLRAEPYVTIDMDVLAVSHAFHFTRIWWLRDQLYYIKRSRDEHAINMAQLRYDLAVAQLMNDVLWMGGPRECVTVDEPE